MRNAILTIFQWLGIFRFWRSLKRNEIIVLYLHGVMDEGVPASWTPLRPQYSRERLDAVISTLKKNYTFITIDDAVEMLKGDKPMQSNSVVLTFDDGYVNNLTHAMPILRKHNVPCAIYIAVGNIEERKPFWFDRLDYAIQHADVHNCTFEVNGENITLDASSRAALRKTFKQLRDQAKKGHRSDLEMRRELSDISEKLETQGNTRLRDIFEDDDWTAVMTWDQIREAHADPLITIGSHTIDHIRLSEVDEDRNMKELIESKAILEAQGISDCTHFCYPNGSLNDDTPGYVRKAGYESAVTTEAGTNPVNTDLMKIKRIHMPDSSDPKMITYVASGMSQAIANIRGNS